jgi:fucose permease
MPSVMALMESQLSFEKILVIISIGISVITLFFFTISFPAPRNIQAIPIKNTFKMVENSSLLLLGMFLFFQSALEGVINNWSTSFLQDSTKMDSSAALYVLSIFILSLTITRVFLAVILRKISPYLILIISMVILLLGSSLLYLNDSTSSIFAFILLGIGASAGFPIILSYVGKLYSELRGTAFSFVIFISLIGNIVINYLMGLIAYNVGINYYPLVLLFCSFFMFILTSMRIRKLVNNLEN